MATLTFYGSGGKMIQVDSEKMRLSRLQRRLSVWARCINEVSLRRKTRVLGLLLTYDQTGRNHDGIPQTWEANHINQFIVSVRNQLGFLLLGYAWVAELHRSGAVHYHVCLVVDNSVPPLARLEIDDIKQWWPYGYSWLRTKSKAGKPYRASSKYLMKYAQKGSDNRGKFPKGLRIFSVVIRCELPAVSSLFFRLSAACSMVRGFIMKLWDDLKKMGQSFNVTGWKWEYLPPSYSKKKGQYGRKMLSPGSWYVERRDPGSGYWQTVLTSEWQLGEINP